MIEEVEAISLYSVRYSEEAGYYINVSELVYKPGRGGGWYGIESGQEFHYKEGWRDSEEKAVALWRDEAFEYANKLRNVALEVEAIAQSRVPVKLREPILRPVIE